MVFTVFSFLFGAAFFFMGMKIEVVDVGTVVVFLVLGYLCVMNMIFIGPTLRCYNSVFIL